MGIESIAPRRRTTQPAAGHKIYPYLLRNVPVQQPDQVWSTDITYVPMRHGFLYLTAVMDWYSRYVLAGAAIEHAGWRVLPGDLGRGAAGLDAGGFQHGPRGAVHVAVVHRTAAAVGDRDQHGRQGAGAGQRVRG